jgi:hypothetical protein
MVCEPMVGWRRVEVTEHRTRVDYANLLKTLVDIDYPQAEKLLIIQIISTPIHQHRYIKSSSQRNQKHQY